MQNFKSEVIRFAVWMRNGVAFCTTWFLILILAYNYIFHIQSISTNDLIKVVLLIIGGVLIFNLSFTRIIIKKMNFMVRLTCFMCAISLYEFLGFYWLGFFEGKGTTAQWLIFIGIILFLYVICAVLYQRYSKKKGKIYTEGLKKYQMERSAQHEK